jgi:hypothetical protein
MRKIITKMSMKVAVFVFDKMKQLELNVQQVIIEKIPCSSINAKDVS